MASEEGRSGIDTTVPHSARIWNYFLGGKDNYEVDRLAGDAFERTFPAIRQIARESRGFIGRVVTYLAGEAGMRQFLDIGTGLPTVNNTHEVAQRVAPEASIVYVDNDPLVLAHARALMTSNPRGATTYIHADMNDPEHLLSQAGEVLDLSAPVAVLFMGVLGHVPVLADAQRLVSTVMNAVPVGSHLALYDGTSSAVDRAGQDAQDDYNDTGAVPYIPRPPAELESLFDGLQLVPPGFVSTPLWRPELADDATVPRIGHSPEQIDQFGGVAIKVRS